MRSSSTKWVTEKPFLIAFTPNAQARCDFPTPRRPQKEHVGLPADVAAGGQRLDLAPVDAGLKAPVEVLERLARGQAGEFEHRGNAALILAFELSARDELQETEGGEFLAGRLLGQLGETARRIVEA